MVEALGLNPSSWWVRIPPPLPNRIIMKKFVFVHVPKAAGTTFYHTLRQCWNENQFYTVPSHWDLFDRDELRGRYKTVNSEMSYNKYSIVKGHFPYYKFQYLKSDHNWYLITWIRDPVERLISNYNHFRYRPVSNKFLKRRAVRVAREMDIVEFSEKVQSNFQTRFVGNDPSVYDFIGVVEKFKESINLFNKQFGLDFVIGGTLNVHNWQKVKVSPEQKRVMREHHKKDYEFYNEVIKRYR